MSIKQDIFDRVARHLMTQKVRCGATNENGDWQCLYRGRGKAEGLRCAAGCLIDDEHYKTSLENGPATARDVASAICGSLGIPYRDYPAGLLLSLQKLHDECEPDNWRKLLAAAAALNNLSPAVLEEFK